jgi:hypothetical protein
MAKTTISGDLILSPATPLKKGSVKPTAANITNGEPGFQKRDGGRFPTINRVTYPNGRLQGPTKK